ncbi:hypothetical protein P5V15_007583 [Pogonomyrmex californicus]
MRKFRKLSQLKRRRERTLNVRLPYTIKDKKDVESLFEGNFYVKLPRQSSRSCHVVFPTVEEKLNNYKHAKNKTVNGKRIVIQSLHDLAFVKDTKDRKIKKKIFIPEIKPDIKITQTLFISNIANGTKVHEIRGAIPGCVRVTLLKPYNKDFRSAIVKMENIQIAAKYLKEKQRWPILKGYKICMKSDTRTKHKKTNLTNVLKLYNEDTMEDYKLSENLNYIENNNDT